MRRPLVWMGLLFVCGELAYRLREESIVYSIITFSLGLSAIILCNIFKHEMNRRLNMLLFLCLFLGSLWAYGYYQGYDDVNPGEYVKMKAYVTEAIARDSGISLTLKTDAGRLSCFVRTDIINRFQIEEESAREVTSPEQKRIYKPQTETNSGQTEINSGQTETNSEKGKDELCPGKYITISGVIEEIEGATNPGAMDMEQYYAGKGIRYKVDVDSISIDRTRANYMVIFLSKLRSAMSDSIQRLFNESDAGIIKTMLLGDKTDIDYEARILYQRSGIAHILAISGLHVALIAGAIEKLLELLRVRKKQAVIIVMIISVFYAIMTGLSAPTLRAVIMIIIARIAFLLGRLPDMPTTMVEALLLMVIINPDMLLSTGMLMSYTAVIGVITSQTFSNQIFGGVRLSMLPPSFRGRGKKLLIMILTSTCLNIWMLPIIIHTYYEVPLYSLALNMVVIPLLTVVIAAGFITSILGMFPVMPETVTDIGVSVVSCILRFYRWLAATCLRLPCAVISTGHLPYIYMLVIYVLITVIIVAIFINIRKESRLTMQLGTYLIHKKVTGMLTDAYISLIKEVAVLCVFMIWFAVFVVTVRLCNLTCCGTIFLDVGQGDCSIIRNADGRNYIVDSGSSNKDNVGRYVLIPALKYYAMTDISCVFISHTDADHINGITYLLQNEELYGIRVSKIALAADTEQSEVDKLRTLSGDRLISLKSGDLVDDSFEVLYPCETVEGEHSGNEYSLVLRYKTKNYEVLYTGDIGSETEKRIVDLVHLDVMKDNRDRRTAILKCPHHGSRYSSSDYLLEAYDPDIVVISCGKHNFYGHPAPETLDRLETHRIRIYRTDQQGAVIITH